MFTYLAYNKKKERVDIQLFNFYSQLYIDILIQFQDFKV